MGSFSIGDTLTADSTDGIISSGWNLSIENDSDVEKFSVVASSGAVSGSGNFSIGGTLKADNLASATVSLTADMMVIDDAASGDIKITSLANYSTAIAGAGLAATAGILAVVNNTNGGINVAASAISIDFNDLSAAAVNVAADSIAFLDADGNVTQKESIADFVGFMAGSGLTATNGVLSSDASPTPTSHGDAAGTLVEGLNYSSAVFTAARIWTLPASPDDGDVISVKAPSNAATYNLTIAKAGSQTIDGETSLLIESSYGAVDLVYLGSDKWAVK